MFDRSVTQGAPGNLLLPPGPGNKHNRNANSTKSIVVYQTAGNNLVTLRNELWAWRLTTIERLHNPMNIKRVNK